MTDEQPVSFETHHFRPDPQNPSSTKLVYQIMGEDQKKHMIEYVGGNLANAEVDREYIKTE